MSLQPKDLYGVLRKSVIGQDEALRYVAVAIFKHLCGEPVGNLMLIGNSGTGKTTIMRAMEQLYLANPSFQKHRVVARMNANTLASEEGEVISGKQLFKTVQDRALQLLGKEATPEKLQLLMEHATICIDEVDKVSATVGGRPSPTGIHIQQSLLTLMEDEVVTYETQVLDGGSYQPLTIELDTRKLLFLCAGAYEELYDQVYARVFEEKGQEELTEMVSDFDGNVGFSQVFSLSDHLRQEDLFKYGMMPQFLSRFDHTLVLSELSPSVLQTIFCGTSDSLLETSKRFFARMQIDLHVTEDARKLIAHNASLSSRVGARALKEVYGHVIKPFEFDPAHEDRLERAEPDGPASLTITEEIVEAALG